MNLLKILFVSSLTFLAFLAGLLNAKHETVVAQIVDDAIDYGHELLSYNDAHTLLPKLPDVKTILNTRHVSAPPSPHSETLTLLTLRYSTSAHLIDSAGNIKFSWQKPFREVWPRAPHVKDPAVESHIHFSKAHVYPNGDLLVIYEGYGSTPYGYGMAKIDKTSKVLWTYDANTHHDFYIDQHTQNIYTLSQQFLQTSNDDSLNGLSKKILADYLVVLNSEGKELKKISILKALANSPYRNLLFKKPANFLDWDVLHTNSVMKLEPEMADKFPMFHTGNVLLSFRNINTIAVLDVEKEQIIWAYDGIWKAQHSARFNPNGTIALLDNLGYYANGKVSSRVIEFNPSTMQLTWQYSGSAKKPLYTFAYGRTQLLDNGNYLITETLGSRILEITRNDEIAWEYQLPKQYAKIDPSMPPYTPVTDKVKLNPIKADLLNIDANLTTAIISAQRYEESELHFLH